MTKLQAIIVLSVFVVNIWLFVALVYFFMTKRWKIVIWISLYFIATFSLNAYTVHYYNIGLMDMVLVKLGWINMDQVNYYYNKGVK
jgi:hypothetical protein